MNLALFDFDGTITTCATLPEFLRFAVPAERIAKGRIRLAPIIVGYRLGVVSGATIRARIVDAGLSGRLQSEIEQAGCEFAESFLPGVIRPQAQQRLNWHRQQGDRIAVVSAGFDVYLAPWCARHGLDLMCSALETTDGVITGRYRGPQCAGEEKCRRVREHYDLHRFGQIYAYGDSAEDRQMLEMADQKFFRWREVA